jgi:hypothetical protein
MIKIRPLNRITTPDSDQDSISVIVRTPLATVSKSESRSHKVTNTKAKLIAERFDLNRSLAHSFRERVVMASKTYGKAHSKIIATLNSIELS